MDFSIIIPAKNEAANIGRCLDSIQQVAWDPSRYEIIVVDNGSSDQTVTIAETKGAKVFSKPELTISGLRNFGAAHSSGQILAFLDADCTVLPNWFEKAALYLDSPEVVCFGSPPIVPVGATWVQKGWFPVRRKKVVQGEIDWLESMNMFVRNMAFHGVRGFDESLITCEDYDLSMRLKQQGLLICDSSIVAVHHGEAATVTHFLRKEFWRGKSNFAGVRQHGLTWAELPSLLAPTLHCLLWILWLLALVGGSVWFLASMSLLLFGWQLLLLFVSLKKLLPDFGLLPFLQLYLLLNLYLFARGVSIFSSGRRSGERTAACVV